MTERLQRLVMHAFRGVPTEMTVDFGNGDSTVVYGENGTGKSTIADALEWYFNGEIELLSHEGRQHAVRHVGGDGDGVTSVEVLTSGMRATIDQEGLRQGGEFLAKCFAARK